MLVTQSNVYDVAVASATVLTIRDISGAIGSNNRTLVFTNLHSEDLNVKLQEYVVDTWQDIGAAFVVEENGTAGYVIVKNLTSLNMIRVLAYGADATQGLKIDYMRNYESDSATWIAPFI